MYAFGVLLLCLATDLPAVLYAHTPRSMPLNAHVRVKLLGEVWDDRRCAFAADGRRDRSPEDVAPAAWTAVPRADTSAWEGPMLVAFGALALRCTEATRQARPPMADVVAGLERLLQYPS